MSRRWMVVPAAALLLALALGSTSLAGRLATGKSLASAFTASSMTVVERALTDAVVDLKPPGDSLGDSLAFGNPLYDASNTNRVGHDEGSCVRTRVGVGWECSWTNIFPKGHITVQGPFYDDGRDSVLSITGGTGIYRDVRGEMRLHWRNATGTEYDFIFTLDH
jgi:allene oxide cyclase